MAELEISCESLERRPGAALLNRILIKCLSSDCPFPSPIVSGCFSLVFILFSLPCYKKGKENRLAILRLHLGSICHLV